MEILFVILPVVMAAFFFFLLWSNLYDYLKGKMSGLVCVIMCMLCSVSIFMSLFYSLPIGIKLNKSKKPPVLEKNVEDKVADEIWREPKNN